MLDAFRPAGVVFDLDGTIVDNMSLHAEAFAAFAARHGLPALTPADRARLDGRRNSEIFPDLFKRALGRDEVLRFEEEKESCYRELSRGRLTPLDGLARLIARLEAHGIPVGIATSAPFANVEHTLGELQLERLMPRTVRADQVRRGKPAPDVFLAAAGLLNVIPERVLAFEDAPMGVIAAKTAGMVCVAITTSFEASTFAATSYPPDATCADYEEFLRGAGSWLDVAETSL
jgi:HAD superfamily hydrolase (TIGR01509 family)